MHPNGNNSSSCAVIPLETSWWLWYRLKLWWFLNTDDKLIQSDKKTCRPRSWTMRSSLSERFRKDHRSERTERHCEFFWMQRAAIENFSSSDLKINLAALRWPDNYIFIISLLLIKRLHNEVSTGQLCLENWRHEMRSPSPSTFIKNNGSQ